MHTKFYGLTAVIFLLACANSASAQLPIQGVDPDGRVRLTRRVDKSEHPDVSNQTLTHIGLSAEDWGTASPRKGLAPSVVQALANNLYVAIFNDVKESTVVESTLSFKPLSSRKRKKLIVAIKEADETGNFGPPLATQAIDLSVEGATLPLKAEVSGDTKLYLRFELEWEGKTLHTYVVLTKAGTDFFKPKNKP